MHEKCHIMETPCCSYISDQILCRLKIHLNYLIQGFKSLLHVKKYFWNAIKIYKFFQVGNCCINQGKSAVYLEGYQELLTVLENNATCVKQWKFSKVNYC